MECNFASDVENFTVPRDEEIFDWLPSPDSWPPWVKIAGNFNSSKKFNVLGVEDHLLNGDAFSSEVEQLLTPSVSQGYRHGSRKLSAYAHEQPDVQLDDLAVMDEADDIFLRSLFEADASVIHGAVSSANNTPTAIGYRDLDHDCRNNVENVGPPPSKVQKSESEICISEEDTNMSKYISVEDISEEESVLLKLQRSTQQLAEETRICFRDSLYRLAENSRHRTSSSQEAEANCKTTSSCEPSRFQEYKAHWSDTNGIDRTVATLLFDTMKICNVGAVSASDVDEETSQRQHEDSYSCLYHPSSPASAVRTLPGGGNIAQAWSRVPTSQLHP